jgi:hypothetical protein
MILKIFTPVISLFFSLSIYAQVYESNVDYSISSALLESGEVHFGYEWLSPAQFKTKDISKTDLRGLSKITAPFNHIIAAKIGFISDRSFQELSLKKMNEPAFIKKMLRATSVTAKDSGKWEITNKVKAYGFYFKVDFSLKLTEANSSELREIAGFMRSEANKFINSGRERFILVEMTDFDQLLYGNFGVVYMREISPDKTLIIATIISAFNQNKANRFFQFPPFSYAYNTITNNFKSLTMGMIEEIKN